MVTSTPDFSLAIDGVKGTCPVGEVYANENIVKQKIPILSCEGPCIRGEIARLAANMVAEQVSSFARCCHAETFVVPHSSMAHWVKRAERVVMIDGCFLKCHGRILKNLIDDEQMIEIDALQFYQKYSDVFLYTDVPQVEREAVAREVAEKIIATLDTKYGLN